MAIIKKKTVYDNMKNRAYSQPYFQTELSAPGDGGPGRASNADNASEMSSNLSTVKFTDDYTTERSEILQAQK